MQLPKRYRSHVVSKGTLFADDLTYKCLHFLQTSKMDRSLTELIAYLEGQYREMIASCTNRDQNEQQTEILYDEIFPLLEDTAPKGCFFGLHPGDPGRLGFFNKHILYSSVRHAESSAN
jgi:hypothetical protein